jgi:hypothetical protein
VEPGHECLHGIRRLRTGQLSLHRLFCSRRSDRGGNPSQSPGGGGALPGNGGGTCLTIFNDGLMGAPKAAVLFQGVLNAVLPSVGFAVAQVTFQGVGNADDGGGGGSDWDDGSDQAN